MAKPNDRKVFLTPEEYEARYGEMNRRKERERNFQLLLKIRPGVFTDQEQRDYDQVREGITQTGYFAVAAFISTSVFRYWQIKTGNKSVLYGLTAILASYAPAMIYYKLQVSKETVFVRGISDKYRDKIDDGKLEAFIGGLPQQEYTFMAQNKS